MNTSELMNQLLRAGELGNVFRKEMIYILKYIDCSTGSTFYNGSGTAVDIAYASAADSDYQNLVKLAVRYTAYLISKSSYEEVQKIVTNCSVEDIKAKFSECENEELVFKQYYQKIAVTGYYAYGLKPYVIDPSFEAAISQRLFFNMYKSDITKIWRFKVLLLMLHCHNEAAADRVLENWKMFDANFCKVYQLDEYLKAYDWPTLFVNELGKDMAIYKTMNQDVKRYSESCRTVHHDAYQAYGGGEGITRRAYDEHFYGEAAVAWVKSTGDANGCYKKESGGCVLAGTLIRLKNGTCVPIECTSKNDMILNVQGSESYLSDELVQNHQVAFLYAVNEDIPFMSLDHAIMTQRGWCAPQPAATNMICPEFQVKTLKIGDRIIKLDDQGKPHEVVVERIHIIENQKHACCYDLHVYDGFHSYYANGYPCLLAYPQLTLAYLKRRIADLAEAERHAVIDKLLTQVSLWEALLGESAKHMITEILVEMEGKN